MQAYRSWLAQERGLAFDADYQDLWHWSVTELDAFWQSIWDYFELQSPTPHTAVLADDRMPGAVWFPGAQVNYARQVLRHADAAHAAGQPALVSHNEQSLAEGRAAAEMSWPELRRQVAALALHLQDQGVGSGDRVAAYLPNVPAAVVALLATASLGAVWSVCAPDMGTDAVLDRFRQIEPKVLIACNGVVYAGREHDRRESVQALCAGLPSLRHVLLLDNLPGLERPELGVDHDRFHCAVARDDAAVAAFEPHWVPFDHPLWIVYSSGTTGLPKPLVHGHGGVMLMALPLLVLHNDVGCSYRPETRGERFFWYSSTGWVMWNCQVGGLLDGTTCCLFDGSPGGSKAQPDWSVLWRFAEQTGVTFFGAGAAFYGQCMKAGLDLATYAGLTRVRALGSTGSPLPEEVERWGTAGFERLGRPGLWWANISGGTDFAGAFIGGNAELPRVPGVMQCRQLGAAVQAWNAQGEPVVDEVGELVCTRPLPSMPLFFWGDSGHARYLASYFDTYPGVWRHGDWIRITPQGGCVIYGRSDATINRHGLRMGTSEIYAAVERLPQVVDALVVDLEYLGKESYMPLFVALRAGTVLDDTLEAAIRKTIGAALSPRFVPDAIFQVPEVPRTLTGKKQELPIKKLLLGQPLERVLNRATMANPESLAWFVAFAERRQALPQAAE